MPEPLPARLPAAQLEAEWLEADGLGGFASGTVSRHPDPALPRAAARRDDAADRARGAGQRLRGLAADRRPAASRSARSATRPTSSTRTARRTSRAFAPEPVAALDASAPTDGTEVEQEVFVLPGPRRRRPALAPALDSAARATLQRAAVPLAAATTTRCTTRTRPSASPPTATASPRALAPLRRACRRSTRWPTAPTRHEPSGTATSSTTPSRSAASTSVEDLASPGVLSWILARGDAAWILDAPARRSPDVAAGLRSGDELPRRAPAAPLRLAPAARRRRLSRAPRRRPDHRRRLSLVHRLGTRHLHRAARPLPGRRAARRRAPHPARLGRRGLRGHAAEPLPRSAARQPEFNSVDASLWYVVAVHEFLLAARQPPAPVDASAARRCSARSRRSSTATPPAPASASACDERRPARRRRARRAADLDGRQGRRLGGDAADRQAGRGAGAVAQRAADRPRHRRRHWADATGARPRRLRRALLERGSAAACSTSSTSITRRHGPTPPCARTRSSRSAACPSALLDGERARGWSTRSSGSCCTPLGLRSLAPDEPGYAAHYEGGVAQRDSRLSPRHGLAVADRPLRRGLGARARQRRRGASARRATRFLAPLLAHLDDAGLGHVSEIADGEPPHTPGAAARSRPGRSASSCGRAGWSRTTARRRSRCPRPGRLRPSERLRVKGRKNDAGQESGHGHGRGGSQACEPRPSPRAPSGRASPRTPGASSAGSAGGRTSASASGARCARTTARTATPGTTSRTTTRAAAPTAGARTASPASATTSSGSASRWRCGTAATRSSRSGSSA